MQKNISWYTHIVQIILKRMSVNLSISGYKITIQSNITAHKNKALVWDYSGTSYIIDLKIEKSK